MLVWSVWGTTQRSGNGRFMQSKSIVYLSTSYTFSNYCRPASREFQNRPRPTISRDGGWLDGVPVRIVQVRVSSLLKFQRAVTRGEVVYMWVGPWRWLVGICRAQGEPLKGRFRGLSISAAANCQPSSVICTEFPRWWLCHKPFNTDLEVVGNLFKDVLQYFQIKMPPIRIFGVTCMFLLCLLTLLTAGWEEEWFVLLVFHCLRQMTWSG